MNKITVNPQPIISTFGRASQEEIGKVVGVSRLTVSAWLNGRPKTVELDVLEKFCKACSVGPGDFFLVPDGFHIERA
mgnify:CR=1 FL=1